MLGERGSNLSGGQRQRLSIARAFVRNTSILILDEPTTGLDAESTELVQRALKTLMKGKTTIIISHDLSLIRNADKIIVIKDGQVDQIGTHEMLLRSGGLYASLYQMQTGQVAGVPVALPVTAEVSPEVASGNGHSVAEMRSHFAVLTTDLPHHPGFLNRLQALDLAFDDNRMKDRLQVALAAPGVTFESCKSGKAIYLPGDVVSLQYVIKLAGEEDQEPITSLVNARMFSKEGQAQSYMRERLQVLAAQTSGRLELRPFAHPIAVLEDLEMVLSVFPIDGEIPTLVKATQSEHMLGVFRDTLPEALSGRRTVEKFKLEPAHYGRFLRCVLRYRITEHEVDSQATQEQVVYGKVDADGQGGLAVPVITTLREQLYTARSPYRFRIPRTLTYLPDLKMLLMEALPGSPMYAPLLKARIRGEEQNLNGSLTLEESIEASARIAATFHSSGIELGRRRTFENEVERLESEITQVMEIMPELGEKCLEWLGQISETAHAGQPLPLAFSHGDYTHTQIIFSGKEAGLVDFDTVCQAEPALDLGQFLAYQRLSIYKEQPQKGISVAQVAEQISQLFISAYLEAAKDWISDPTALTTRVEIYELISLLRLAVHSWQKLKGSRLQAAIDVLQERLACLPQTG
jgi:energy-coupling factor transporter ATP-binding protein EcfA2